MEITVQCSCGARYKFEAEPVHGRMPAPVSCPDCGVDGTAFANEFIRTVLTSNPALTPTAAPSIQAGSSGVPAFNQPAPRFSSGPSTLPPAFLQQSSKAPASDKPRKSGLGIPTTILILACVGFGSWHFCTEALTGFRSAFRAIETVMNADGGFESNFRMEDGAAIYIRHSDHSEVAQACKEYWSETLKKTLATAENLDNPESGHGLFELFPAHNGYVEFLGGLDWPQAQQAGLAQYLSQRFNTLVFEVRNRDFGATSHFNAYDQGTRKFHAEMQTDDQGEETVATDGNEWALANGYEPLEAGFKEFTLDDADGITQHLGLKTWDRDYDQASVWLQEAQALPAVTARP
jgi:hypothetical protein